MQKTKSEINRDIAALNLVYQHSDINQGQTPNRFYIMNEGNSIIVWDRQENKEVHKFGTCSYYAELMTAYAELPCDFN